MNDIRRTILWVIFGFSMVLLWDKWQIHNGQKGTFMLGTTAKPAASAPAAASSVPTSSGVPAASGVPSASTAAVPIPGGATASSVPGGPAAPAGIPREQIVVTNDVVRLTFDSEGGSIVKTEFLKQTDDAKTGNFVLLEQNAGRVYVAQSGLIGGTFPTHKTPMTVSGDRTLRDGANELAVKFESADIGGVKLVKSYTLRRGATTCRTHEVVNPASAPVAPQLYLSWCAPAKISGRILFYSITDGGIHRGQKSPGEFRTREGEAEIDKDRQRLRRDGAAYFATTGPCRRRQE